MASGTIYNVRPGPTANVCLLVNYHSDTALHFCSGLFLAFSLMLRAFQHRSLQPSGPQAAGPSQPHNPHGRLSESFEVIKQEFDQLASELNAMRKQRDEYESKSKCLLDHASWCRS